MGDVEDGADVQTAPATALSIALTDGTNSESTADTITDYTTLDFTVSHTSFFGGTTGDRAHIFHKQGACINHTIPSISITVAAPENNWEQYGTGVNIETHGTSFTVTDGTSLTEGSHCFFAAFANGTSTTPSSHSTGLEVTIDTTAPTVVANVLPTRPDTRTKFSHTGDVALTLKDSDNFGTATALSADGTLMAVGACLLYTSPSPRD